MSYSLKNGKLIRKEKLRRRPPEREPIKTPHRNELFLNGPVKEMARRLAHNDLMASLRAKGRRYDVPLEHESVTVMLYNAQEYYWHKAKFYLEGKL